jgi:hypothetical protein
MRGVEGEVVPGPGGHAHVGDVVLNGDCHHRCLRPVTPGDADGVRTSFHRSLGHVEQVVAALKHDRLDAPGGALPDQVVTPGLASA